MSKVAQQSVPISFESDQPSFKSYLSGVFDRCMRQEMFNKAAFNSNSGG